MNNFIFETHAHYEDEAFNEDREALIASLSSNGIGRVVNVGSTMDTSKKSIELAQKYEFIYAAIGIHPSEIKDITDKDLMWIESEAMNQDKVVAIGEIGLDYHWDKDNKAEQRKCFEQQISIAKRTKLPMIIHSREAAADTVEVMKKSAAEACGGVIHCFSYSVEEARKYLEMGFYIGIGGAATFKNAVKIKDVISYVPMERILLETDCPYMAPVPLRGTRNSSLNLPYVAKIIAEIKRTDYDTVINMTYENACKMYGVK